jgi:hypothetical protein
MTGSSLAPLSITMAGTLCLGAWLALVFYAGHRLRGAEGHHPSGAESPGRPHLIRVPAPAGSPRDLLAASSVTGDLPVPVEVER